MAAPPPQAVAGENQSGHGPPTYRFPPTIQARIYAWVLFVSSHVVCVWCMYDSEATNVLLFGLGSFSYSEYALVLFSPRAHCCGAVMMFMRTPYAPYTCFIVQSKREECTQSHSTQLGSRSHPLRFVLAHASNCPTRENANPASTTPM